MSLIKKGLILCSILLCSTSCIVPKTIHVHNTVIDSKDVKTVIETDQRGSDPSDSLNGNKGSIDVPLVK